MQPRPLMLLLALGALALSCVEDEVAPLDPATLPITVLAEPCGDWVPAAATEPAEVPEDPAIPYLRRLHETNWSSDRRSIHDPGPPLRSE
jgi:hypothetical protein